jgi:predicted membrane channel-forming protein YqfA (hemolysin III family)
MALVDIVAVVVLLGAAVAFFFGSTALARAEDLSAAYWLIVGTLAMRSAVHLVRTAPER